MKRAHTYAPTTAQVSAHLYPAAKTPLPCVSLCISASSHSQTLFQRGLFLLANIPGPAAIINEALSGWEGISDPHVSQTQAMSLDPLSFDKPYVTSRMLICGAHPDPPAQRSLAPQHLVCAVCQPALVSTLPHSLPNLGTIHEATRLPRSHAASEVGVAAAPI